MRQLLLFFAISIFYPCLLFSQQDTAFIDQQAQRWVDSVFNQLTQEERLGQLFVIRAHSDKGLEHIKNVETLIKKYQVGGLCFFQGTPTEQAKLTNQYQELAKVPLMISIDAEWGLGMRMKKTTISYPRQLMLGAIQDNRLIYEMGREIARQMRRIGMHVNYAPVADINNNAANPVINTRSFGEDRYNVATKSYLYMKGLQDGKVMACAKHFPGHGDTDVDSHYDLPVIPHSLERLDSLELYPFQALINEGVQSIMVAHLNVPALDSTKNRPTSLSQKVVTHLLKNKMGFEGLVCTDGLEMKGVTKYFKPGQVEAEALLAGNDILLLPDDISASFRVIKEYLEAGKLTWETINQRVKKVLLAKYHYDLHQYQPVPIAGIDADISSPQAKFLKKKLIKNALTLVRNKQQLVPFQQLDTLQIASLSIGAREGTPFQRMLSKYTPMEHYQVSKEIGEKQFKGLMSRLKKFEVVVIGLHDMNNSASNNYGITRSSRAFIQALSEETNVVLTVFGNPYALKYFDPIDPVLQAYDEDEMTQELAAQALFGVNAIRGRLPVTASKKSKFNSGMITTPLGRMGYEMPETMGIKTEYITRLDRLLQHAVDTGATPGGVVLVAKNGQIVLEKAFGYHTYQKKQPVATNDVFDLASITKIASATLSVMKLVDEGKIDLDAPISQYLPELKNTNKQDMVLYDIMAHQAGLKSWIPFFEQTVDNRKRPMAAFYKKSSTPEYNILVADQLYLKNDFPDKIWQQIIDSEVGPKGRYVYSDLGFYLIARMVQRITGKPINEYTAETFYRPLGLSTAGYNPLQKFPKSRIVPTEEDGYWRQQRVHGYVHDMGAAMLGGVSGHAGLFASAKDLAVIMQLLLNEGYYGGKQYFSSQAVKQFTHRHPKSTRRGIGFDMLELDKDRDPNLSPLASVSTFGHLGFTGTCAWADPEHNLIYIFLSNRTYPSMNNKKLYKGDFRPRGQSIIYTAITSSDSEEEGKMSSY